ncbi:MAG: hypothetical protein C0483_03510 [Pirellula sp.]|nr:hypothetical protein [Pirellula sp.]
MCISRLDAAPPPTAPANFSEGSDYSTYRKFPERRTLIIGERDETAHRLRLPAFDCRRAACTEGPTIIAPGAQKKGAAEAVPFCERQMKLFWLTPDVRRPGAIR